MSKTCPSKYDTKLTHYFYQLEKDPLSDRQIAKALGIGKSTVQDFRSRKGIPSAEVRRQTMLDAERRHNERLYLRYLDVRSQRSLILKLFLALLGLSLIGAWIAYVLC